MKNQFTLLMTVTLSLCATASLGSCANKSFLDLFIDAAKENAQNRIDNVKKTAYEKFELPTNLLRKEYPSNFDLRCVDSDNDNIAENYVTGVKQQSPFGTCWAFGTIAAAETSILFDKKQSAVRIDEKGNPRDSLDLSEHQLAWFTYTPLNDNTSQNGEGLISKVDNVDKNPSLKLNSGSTQFAGSTMFVSGIGPFIEPDFDNPEEGLESFNYHGKNYVTKQHSSGFPIYSEEDDWSIDESLRFRQSFMLEDSYVLPASAYVKDGVFDVEYCDNVVKCYKEQIINGRAIAISYCADNYNPNKVNRVAKYISVPNYAHYCYEAVPCNHTVCVVGWDDSYSKNNFLDKVQLLDEQGLPMVDADGNPVYKNVNRPEKDGAWIVKNSWGALDTISDGLSKGSWGFNGTGYFYLSYYDRSICSPQCFDFDVTDRLPKLLGKYNLDEYDLMPLEKSSSIRLDFPVKEANVFTIEEDETIKDVSVVSTHLNEEITIEISLLTKDNPKELVNVGTFTQKFLYPGIHHYVLPNSFFVKKDDKVEIRLTQKDDKGYLVSLGCEFNEKGYNSGYCDDKYVANGIVNEGESYLYLNNSELVDFANIKRKLESLNGPTSYFSYDNFPIKMFGSL